MYLIACVDSNWAIGKNNKLLFDIPEDLKRFKKYTNNSIVVMGRKTWESLPVKPLKNRINVIICSDTSDLSLPISAYDNYASDGSMIRTNLENLENTLTRLKNIHEKDFQDVYIIGGEMLYKELVDKCSMAIITKVNKAIEDADRFFPNLDGRYNWSKSMSIKTTYKDRDGNDLPVELIHYINTNTNISEL